MCSNRYQQQKNCCRLRLKCGFYEGMNIGGRAISWNGLTVPGGEKEGQVTYSYIHARPWVLCCSLTKEYLTATQQKTNQRNHINQLISHSLLVQLLVVLSSHTTLSMLGSVVCMTWNSYHRITALTVRTGVIKNQWLCSSPMILTPNCGQTNVDQPQRSL